MQRPALFKLTLAAALLVLFASIAGIAQNAPAPKYDKSTEVKIKGTIDEVKLADDKNVHVMLKTDKGIVDVFVAPQKFLNEMELTFAKGDVVEILGSQVTVNGAPLLLAREVIRGGDTMTMRDENGKPVWIGWIK